MLSKVYLDFISLAPENIEEFLNEISEWITHTHTSHLRQMYITLVKLLFSNSINPSANTV